MEKRYQVFISSTLQDLKGARQEVSQALLRADCFPAGMELFPAADEEQFEFIKQVIDQSDYYIVISAGRYGSIHPVKALSYTELEYDYALEIGMPAIRLLHKDPFNKLRGEHIEQTDDGREKLRAFREKMSAGSMVRFWEDPKELGAEVVYGIMDARKRKPAVGWVRADGRATAEVEREAAELRQKIAELELELERKKHTNLDCDGAIKSMAGNTKIIVIYQPKQDPFGNSVDGARQEFTCATSDLCKAICVSCLQQMGEGRIKDSACSNLLRGIDGFDQHTTSRFEFEKKDHFLKLMHYLESKGILRSEPAVRRLVSHSSTYLNWYLSDGARQWASGLASVG